MAEALPTGCRSGRGGLLHARLGADRRRHVTGWLRSAAIAGAPGQPMSTHLYPEFSAHLMRVTETADWLEWRDWVDPLLAKPFEVRGSAIHIPDRPGAGIAWDEAAVKRFAIYNN
jgi:mandelate racemase